MTGQRLARTAVGGQPVAERRPFLLRVDAGTMDALRAWALRVEARTCHNKAAIALANKLARIIWAT